MAHVFVMRGDLLQVACDAWLVSGGSGGPGHAWRPALPPKSKWLVREVGWSDDDRRTTLLAETEPPEPLPFLTNITGTNRDSPEWYVDGARRFVRMAAQTLRSWRPQPLHGRAKHLLAMPLVGTGGGGGGHLSGEVVRLLLRAMREEANAADVDIAVVLLEGPAWAAAQHERLEEGDESFAELATHLRKRADELATMARNGDLVLFLGAGVSQGAGLPSWTSLLQSLAAERASMTSSAEQEALMKLGELDRAAVIKRRLATNEPVGRAVAALLRERTRRHSLAHGLLASLPVEEVITTNYDDLFERASAAVERPCTVLPGGQVARGRRWLLKMHGCVTRPESIVLTREDYMKFQENRTALAGIVQALLLTRHMLFVGFSFADDNFHRIAHAVRQSMGTVAGVDGGVGGTVTAHDDAGGNGGSKSSSGRAARAKFGSTLVVGSNPLAEELWGDELDWLSWTGSIAEQARLLEIFLDRLACASATATSHLGDRRYDAVLTDGERKLRDRLEAFLDGVSDDEKRTGAYVELDRLMRRLGITRRMAPGRARDRVGSS